MPIVPGVIGFRQVAQASSNLIGDLVTPTDLVLDIPTAVLTPGGFTADGTADLVLEAPAATMFIGVPALPPTERRCVFAAEARAVQFEAETRVVVFEDEA